MKIIQRWLISNEIWDKRMQKLEVGFKTKSQLSIIHILCVKYCVKQNSAGGVHK